jgi:hypothetical protein
MAQKRSNAAGVFETAGKAVDESMTMAEAIRSGKLTRAEFEAWYSKRTAERAAIVVNLRESSSRLLEPIESVLARGQEFFRPAQPPRRSRRRPARASSRTSARRK